MSGMKVNMMHPAYAQMKVGPKFISNPQKQTFDPRLLNNNAKMMQMMAQNAQLMNTMYPGVIPMMKPAPGGAGFIMNNGIPMQIMGYNVAKPLQHPRINEKGKIVPRPLQTAHIVQGPPNIDPSKFKQAENQPKQSKHNPCSIFVKNIPSEKNKIGTLVGYFSKFGEVTNVSVNSNKNTAVVKFETPANAKSAYM